MVAIEDYIIGDATTYFASGYKMRVATLYPPFSAPEAQSCNRSVLGFGNPLFCNGSSHVSTYGLWDPNIPRNITIIGASINSIQMTIIIKMQSIVRIIDPCIAF